MMIQYFNKNLTGSDYVVGDIHGCFTELENVLDDIDFDSSVDRLFCVGDLVDRGQESPSFLKWLNYDWFHSVRGNHEDLLIGNYENDQSAYHCHVMNGGLWFEDCTNELRKKMYEVCLTLPYIIEIETDTLPVGILHADTGVCYDWNRFKDNIENDFNKARETCLWSRMRINNNDSIFVEGVKKIFVGHTPLHSPIECGNISYIDTGACFESGCFTIKRIE